MKRIDDLEELGLQISFNHILYLMENKNKLTKNSSYYLKSARDYLKNLEDCLESVLNFEESKGYYFSQYLTKMIELFNEGILPKVSSELSVVKEKFVNLRKSLDLLEVKSKEFQKSKNYEINLEYLNKINNFFNEKNSVQVFN